MKEIPRAFYNTQGLVYKNTLQHTETMSLDFRLGHGLSL